MVLVIRWANARPRCQGVEGLILRASMGTVNIAHHTYTIPIQEVISRVSQMGNNLCSSDSCDRVHQYILRPAFQAETSIPMKHFVA